MAPDSPRLIALTMAQMAEVQEHVLAHPDYPQCRADADAAYVRKMQADAEFAAAQERVNQLWACEAARYVEEHDL